MANFKVSSNVVAQRVEDQVVVVNLATNRIFALNSTGARLWELLAAGLDRHAIEARLIQEYEVDAAALRPELDDLLAKLKAESLVEHVE